MSENETKSSAYEKLTPQRKQLVDQVLANLEKGNLFWTQGWVAAGAPESAVTGKQIFQKTLRNTLKHLVSRKGWKYIGVWERSASERLHFHGIFYIPENAMVGELKQISDYSTKQHRMQTTYQNTHFLRYFGRNDFKAIDKNDVVQSVRYLLKYIEKSGESLLIAKEDEMRTGSKQKLKYVIILEILRQETDADHPMQTNTLLKKLEEQGIECSRETLYSDIKALNENGYEILCNRSSSNEYYVEDRSFDVPEIRILIDAVNAASFITPKKTDELVGKVAALGGSRRGEIMKSETKIYNTTKHSNEYIYYSINEIELAITQKKKVSFYYFDYNEKKEKVFRKGKKRYYINPYAMLISNDNYYLIGYNDYYRNFLHFRIDRMTETRISHYDIVESGEIDEFDLAKHYRQLFGMYSGDEQTVKLSFDKNLIDVVIDKFGESVKLVPQSEDSIETEVDVQVSPQFIAWVNSFGKQMKVLSPGSVVKQIKESLIEALSQYGDALS